MFEQPAEVEVDDTLWNIASFQWMIYIPAVAEGAMD